MSAMGPVWGRPRRVDRGKRWSLGSAGKWRREMIPGWEGNACERWIKQHREISGANLRQLHEDSSGRRHHTSPALFRLENSWVAPQFLAIIISQRGFRRSFGSTRRWRSSHIALDLLQRNVRQPHPGVKKPQRNWRITWVDLIQDTAHGSKNQWAQCLIYHLLPCAECKPRSAIRCELLSVVTSHLAAPWYWGFVPTPSKTVLLCRWCHNVCIIHAWDRCLNDTSRTDCSVVNTCLM